MCKGCGLVNPDGTCLILSVQDQEDRANAKHCPEAKASKDGRIIKKERVKLFKRWKWAWQN